MRFQFIVCKVMQKEAYFFFFWSKNIVDVVLMDKVLGLVQAHSIVSQAPAVLACGVIGGIVAARWSPGAGARLGKQHKEQGKRT